MEQFTTITGVSKLVQIRKQDVSLSNDSPKIPFTPGRSTSIIDTVNCQYSVHNAKVYIGRPSV